jgi:heme exporter protein D
MKTLGVLLAIATLGLAGHVVEAIAQAGLAATAIIVIVLGVGTFCAARAYLADQADRADREYARNHPAKRVGR